MVDEVLIKAVLLVKTGGYCMSNITPLLPGESPEAQTCRADPGAGPCQHQGWGRGRGAETPNTRKVSSESNSLKVLGVSEDLRRSQQY